MCCVWQLMSGRGRDRERAQWGSHIYSKLIGEHWPQYFKIAIDVKAREREMIKRLLLR